MKASALAIAVILGTMMWCACLTIGMLFVEAVR